MVSSTVDIILSERVLAVEVSIKFASSAMDTYFPNLGDRSLSV